MKSKLIIIPFLLISLSIAQVPEFGPPITLQDGGSTLSGLKYPSPIMLDWDEDGKKDLLLGIMDSEQGSLAARIKVFLNKGENNDPEFDGYDWVRTTSGGILEGHTW